jgi:hypothetical protein
MQTNHEDATRVAAEIQPGVAGAEQFDKFVVDEFDDLLARLNALDDFLTDGFAFDTFNEIAGHLEIHIGFQQRKPDFAQRVGDIGFGDLAEAAQVAERALEFAA